MVLVLEKDEAEDAPHVILKVGVEEVHRPTLLLWWKTAQHQQTGIGGQEGFEGVFLDGWNGGLHGWCNDSPPSQGGGNVFLILVASVLSWPRGRCYTHTR